MAIPVIMPKQGQSVETCIITKWFRKKGESIKTGELLFSYETDKAAFDMESPSDGTVLEIFYGEGAEVPVLVNVAVIGIEGESLDAFLPSDTVETSVTTYQTKEDGGTEKVTIMTGEIQSPADFSAIRISPRAKRLAGKHGIDFAKMRGSGPNGRIVSNDIQKAISSNTGIASGPLRPDEEFTEQPLSNVRKLIAKAMASSLQTSAQVTHHMSADVRKILEARTRIKEEVKKGASVADITLNDMICRCIIHAIKNHPEINSHFLEDRIKTFRKVHLGIAVDTPRGLMVPVVRDSDDLTLEELSERLKTAAESCRKGKISPELLQSTAASFTVSNLGNYGVEMFTPVLNLPQVAILGVCTITYRPADLGNSTFGFVPFIGLSLTYDHRAVDGGPATIFLREVKKQIENFSYPV